MSLIIKLLSLPRLFKQIIVFLTDVVLSITSCLLVFYFKFDTIIITDIFSVQFLLIPILTFIPFFIVFGLYAEVFRYSGINSLKNIFIATLFYGLAIIIFIYLLNPDFLLSIILLQILIFFIFVSITRLVLPSLLFQITNLETNNLNYNKKNALIYGSGYQGIKILQSSEEFNFICFVDDDPRKWNLKINGLKIYDPKKINNLIKSNEISKVFIAISKINSLKRRSILKIFDSYNIGITFLNDNESLLNSKIEYNSKNSKLNIEDINPRNTSSLVDLSELIKNKVVMVSGAGGSIGSEISKQLIKFQPGKIILLDNSEYNLFIINNEVNKNILSTKQDIKIIPKILDIRDEDSIKNIYQIYKPEFIFHAAAYKHVSIVEDNICETIKTNILGTKNLIKNLKYTYCKNFIFISSDKAVRPTNFMGASKRFSEIMIQNMSKNSDLKTVFSIVRFGNVFRSTGSVIPLFDQQISNGGPITVTDPNATRYFMSISEAAKLVLYACQISKGGEVFVLNMGEPLNILKIAEKMIKLSGNTVKNNQNPKGEIEIKFTGLKDGEKLHEELLIGDNLITTDNSDILIANETFPSETVINNVLTKLNENLDYNSEEFLTKIIFDCIEKK